MTPDDDPPRLIDEDGPAPAALRAYARRTAPGEVERWLGRPARVGRFRPAAVAGGLIALLGLWLVGQPGVALDPSPRGGVGGAEGASGVELGNRGGHGGRSPARGDPPSG